MLELDEQKIDSRLKLTRNVDNNRLKFKGVLNGDVHLHAMEREQFITCKSNVQHGSLPTKEAGLSVKVLMGKTDFFQISEHENPYILFCALAVILCFYAPIFD